MIKFLQQTWLGIRTYADAIKFIADNRLWHYFVFPAILSGLFWLGAWWLEQNISEKSVEGVSTIREFMFLQIRNFLVASMVVMAYKLRKYIVFIVLSPLLSKLSLKTEEIMTGNRYNISLRQYWSDIRRAIRIATGNFILEYSIFAAWYIFILFVADARPLTTAFLFTVGCYFYGFCMMDYINERYRMNIAASVKFVREHAGFAFGNGLVFSALFFIPYDIGVLFAPVLGIIAATIGMHILIDLNKNPHAIRPGVATE